MARTITVTAGNTELTINQNVDSIPFAFSAKEGNSLISEQLSVRVAGDFTTNNLFVRATSEFSNGSSFTYYGTVNQNYRNLTNLYNYIRSTSNDEQDIFGKPARVYAEWDTIIDYSNFPQGAIVTGASGATYEVDTDSNGNKILKQKTNAEGKPVNPETGKVERAPLPNGVNQVDYDTDGNRIGSDGKTYDDNGNVIKGNFPSGKIPVGVNSDDYRISNEGDIVDTDGRVIGSVLPDGVDVIDFKNGHFIGSDGKIYDLEGNPTNFLPNGVGIEGIDSNGNYIGTDGKTYDSDTGLETLPPCSGVSVSGSDVFDLTIFGYNDSGEEISDTVTLFINDTNDKSFSWKSWSSDTHKLMTQIRRIIFKNVNGASIGDGEIKLYGIIAGVAVNDSESSFVDNVIGRWELIATARFSRCSQYATVEINKNLKIGEHLDWGDLTYRFLGLRGDYRLEYSIVPFVGSYCCDDYNADEKGSGSSGSSGDSTGTTEITEKLDDLIDKFDDLIAAIKGIQFNDVEVVVTPSDNVSIAKIQYRLSDTEE